MGRSPSCSENGLKKGPWTEEEDQILMEYIHKHGGHGRWRALPKRAGLNRCGKSCRLRWTNYLRPDIKRGNFSQEEEHIIINLHSALGNKWSQIAAHLPGRTDNEIKNFWNTHLRRKFVKCGIDPKTHQPICDLNFLANLSHLISLSTSNITNLMSPLPYNAALGLKPYNITRPAANTQLLQNLYQLINSTTYPLPNIDPETSLSHQFHCPINGTSTAPLSSMNNIHGEEPLNVHVKPQRDGENLAVKSSAACFGSGEFRPQVVHNKMPPAALVSTTIPENSAVKETLESIYSTCIPTDTKPAVYNNFEDLEELMDDFEDDTSFWKDIINFDQ